MVLEEKDNCGGAAVLVGSADVMEVLCSGGIGCSNWRRRRRSWWWMRRVMLAGVEGESAAEWESWKRGRCLSAGSARVPLSLRLQVVEECR